MMYDNNKVTVAVVTTAAAAADNDNSGTPLYMYVEIVRAFNCTILYCRYLLTLIPIITGIPSPLHSFQA